MPPLGYDVVERKLVPNPEEAQLVREMFSRFAALPSMATLVKDLRARGVTSKTWITTKGTEHKGKLIDKPAVYKIFSNAVLNACVTDTKVTLRSSKISTSLAKSASDRESRSIL